MIRKRFKDIYQEGKHIAVALQISTIDSYERNFRWARTWTLWILKNISLNLVSVLGLVGGGGIITFQGLWNTKKFTFPCGNFCFQAYKQSKGKKIRITGIIRRHIVETLEGIANKFNFLVFLT